MNWIRTALVLSLAVVVGSCSDSTTSEPEDTEPPVVTITSPTTGATHETGETSLTISGTATDDEGVASVTWAVAGGASGAATGTTSWTATVDLSDGSNAVTVEATDAAGNVGSASLTVIVDATAPTVVIESPTTEGEYLTDESPVAVSGTASDDSEVDRVEWSVEGGASGTADGTTAWSIPGVELSEGEQVLTVTAYDGQENSASATLTITLDQTAPELAITQPTSSSDYSTVAQAVNTGGVASDAVGLDRVEWSVEGGASGTADGTESWTALLDLLPGANEITVTAYDLAGNSASATVTVHRFHALGAMGLSPSAILTNSTQPVRVTATLVPGLAAGGEGVRLVEVDADNNIVGERAELLDDGDLDNGDEILGDGVYSAQIVISEAEAGTLRLQVVADVSGGTTPQARSPVTLLAVNEPTSLAEDALQEAVQLEAASSLDTKLQAGTGLSDAIAELVTEISAREGVTSAEAEGANAITIRFDSGLLGGLLFTRTDASGNQITRGGPGTGGPQTSSTSRTWSSATPTSPVRTWTSPQATAPVRTSSSPWALNPDATRMSDRSRASSSSWSLPPGAPPIQQAVRPDTIDRSGSATVPLSMQTVGSSPWAAPSAAQGFEPPPDVILNRRVLIFAPYEAVWAPFNEGPDLVAMLEDSPLEFDITYVQNQEATVAVLQSLTEYGLVVFATHGASGRHLLTGEVATDQKKTDYDALRQAGQVTVFTKIEIDEDESGAAIQEDVFGITDAFVSALAGTFPQSLIFNNSCESTRTTDLLTAFIDKGAEAYAGYPDVVNSDFAVDMVLELIEPMVSADLRTVAQAFVSGQTDPRAPNTEFEIWGNGDLHFAAEYLNGAFEFGSLIGWTAVGDGRVIGSLGTEVPVEGSFMGVISTGLGFTTTSGAIFQTFRVPEDAGEMEIHWNFISEEFLEWIGSAFQDEFLIRVTRADGSEEILYHRTVDDIAAEFDCPENGGPNCKLIPVSPGIVFDVGDVHMTGWQTLMLDFTPYRGELITLRFEATDVGDSVYDTAILLDGMVLH